MKSQSAASLAAIHNKNGSSETTLASISTAGVRYFLRLNGVGDGAHFEWVNEYEESIGEIFYGFTPTTLDEFESSMATKH